MFLRGFIISLTHSLHYNRSVVQLNGRVDVSVWAYRLCGLTVCPFDCDQISLINSPAGWCIVSKESQRSWLSQFPMGFCHGLCVAHQMFLWSLWVQRWWFVSKENMFLQIDLTYWLHQRIMCCIMILLIVFFMKLFAS